MMLQGAEAQGWLTYLGLTPRPGRRQSDLFRVRLLSGRVRELEGPAVAPWLRGFTDAHGVPQEILDRLGLPDTGHATS